MNPLDYSLCCQTVTVYRKIGTEIVRQVVSPCHLSGQHSTPTENFGKSLEKKFRLIIPGNNLPLQPGDRVFDGIGPESVDWRTFVPAAVPELYEVSFAKPCYWAQEVTHWEAGHKKEAL